jgi:Glycosyltransferase family 87
LGLRRDATIAAVLGAAVFLCCCALVRGGPLDSTPYGDVHLYALYASHMAHGQWPYRDFFDEYPPLAQPLFYVVRLLPGSYAPAFRWTMTLFGAAALALLVASIASLGATRLRLATAAAAAGVAPIVVGPIFLNAYDLWPALLTAGALLALVRRRERSAYVLLALAVAAKVYPIVLLPIVVVETWRRGGRDPTRRALAWFVGVLIAVHVPVAIAGPGGLRYSYSVQLRRGLEVESLGGALLLVVHHATLVAGLSTNVSGSLADGIAALSSLVALGAVLAVAWLYARRRGGLLVAAAAAVVAFVAFGKVFSPQYVDWLVPLVPAAGAVASALMLGALALTRVVFDRFHAPGGPNGAHYKAALEWWALGRDLIVVALYAWLVARLRRKPASSTT